ncbi:M50 family metallopeptidase [Amnibacterium setariae]|uniref:Peptidase n=1 Tax=Amnibacterium setariae TaxID=2306585 RepID=A0A3A1U500_9MICO|nr:site-2 protease family protein [Amnibacterium setariae]RIX31433.1 peptidase [Amnibacterium setariae]
MEPLLYLAGVLVILVGVVVSIGLHEVGHLLPAKLFGVRVTQYMIGFGRTVWSRRRGETEYGFKAIPLGGYISMVGMFPPAKQGRRERLFQGRPPATAGEAVEDVVEEVEAPSRGRTASTGFFNTLVQDARDSSQDQIQPGEEHRAFYRLAVWKRVVIMLGGPTVNLILGILFTGILLTGFGVVTPTTTVAAISQCIVPATQTRDTCTASDAPAPAAGTALKPGDRITAIDGKPVSTWDDVTAVIRTSAGRPIELTVAAKAGGTERITVTPATNTVPVTNAAGAVEKDANGATRTQTVGFIGITSTEALQRQPVTAVVPAVWNNVTAVAGVIVNLPARLVGVAQAAFGSGERDPNGPISVVGVGRVAGEIAANPQVTVTSKVASLVGILGSLNIALFVFNLIPLLPLDGGHVIGALWEGLRRRVARLLGRRDPGPVDTAKLMPLTFAVAILLGGMSVLLIYADLVRPISIF